MKLKEIIPILEELAPLGYAEDFDNVGLLVGDYNSEINGILVCHDALETVVEEAIAKKCNMIVCFHPIIFSGMKKITGKNYVERAVIKAIKNDIAIYAIHTALDNHQEGVNKVFCDTLGVKNPRILLPKESYIQKLITYAPKKNAEEVKQVLFKAGAGAIGNYDQCSFISEGKGSFRGNENSNPVIGDVLAYNEVEEVKVEVVFEKHLQSKVLSALFALTYYEEKAYELYTLENKLQNVGMGMIGELEEAMDEVAFLQMVKEKTGTGGIRYSALLDKKIKRVAVLGGSGSFAIKAALAQKADVYVTSDLKYHDFYQAENQIVLADIGHFESERYTKNYIVEFLSKKMPTFAVILSTVNTNPVNYL
ncbi:MAG: Nif3-like dinuclear metal center hexameric protein [Flavobacteriaceae bacterium]|jgi:dinuclear metal center YbgI/SA1388 family protein|nr:Nif3-like dinuclear metal center hexameric protein [Flavobacteriaceae bacterium]